MDLLLSAASENNEATIHEICESNAVSEELPERRLRKPCKSSDKTCWDIIAREVVENGRSVSTVAGILNLHRTTVSKISKAIIAGKSGPLKRGGSKKS